MAVTERWRYKTSSFPCKHRVPCLLRGLSSLHLLRPADFQKLDCLDPMSQGDLATHPGKQINAVVSG